MTERARIIHIRIEAGEEGLLYATSPEMPGLLVAEKDMDALMTEVPRVIKALFEALGDQVVIIETERPIGSATLDHDLQDPRAGADHSPECRLADPAQRRETIEKMKRRLGFGEHLH